LKILRLSDLDKILEKIILNRNFEGGGRYFVIEYVTPNTKNYPYGQVSFGHEYFRCFP
jgi:hypothetical protein